jgi:hypothetical protein
MPKLQLTQQFVDNPPIVQHKTKTDYFDTRLTGFFLEVRATGKATYYQRYRDKHRRNRQVRIGPADAMSLEEAREAARQVRSSITNGFDPHDHAQKQKQVPLFSEFVEKQYLPHVKVYKRSWHQDEQMIHRHIESKTGKSNVLVINKSVFKALQLYAAEVRPGPEDYLFRSRKGNGHLTSQSVGRLIKSWTSSINLKGQYGAHTLRKTWGYCQRVYHSAGYEILCKRYNHSSPAVTMRYLGIEDREVCNLLMNEIG